ncbi:MAG TPA: cupin domain-containing protein [Bryobacteraceae bacterium]|jgi:uncharacterized protein YbjT (DUF2867 family)/quercetin dioxygenase-like cupin family protein
MKIVVIGGSGLIGSKLVNMLRTRGHEVVAASPTFGVNTLSGEGLNEALEGASVVVDVSNPASFEAAAAMSFFETSTRNLLACEATAGVGHHVALSVVGMERLPEYGYFRAKLVQENLIKASSIPYSIVRATQFFEFIGRIADDATRGNTVRLSSALIQPMAADDVAGALARVSVGTPVNSTVEIAGPEPFHLDELIRHDLNALNDSRKVISEPHAHYFGGELKERTLVPDNDAQLGETRFESWLSQYADQRPSKSLQPPAGASRRERFSGSSTLMVVFAALVVCILALSGSLTAQAKEAQETITSLLTNDLSGVPGKEVLMYTVDFPPGFASPIHRHNAQVSVYVLEGSVVMQVRGGKEVTLGPGQSFYESPKDIHVVSRNASSTKPAKFLVSLIHDKGDPLVIPAK